MHTLSQVDLNLFTVFDAIYTEGSVSAAARKLNLSQPAVSHALARLRQLLGDPLFERQGHRMVSSPAARSLIDTVRASLRGFELTLNQVDHFDPSSSERRFTLALRDMLEAATLPALMAQVAQRAPRVEIAAARVARRDLALELAGGGIDAAIDILLPLPPQIRHARLAQENTVVLARAGHPALGPDNTLGLPAYLASAHVLVSSRREGLGIEDFALSRLGLARQIRLRCQHYFAACQVVSETDLLLTIPARFARILTGQFGNLLLALPFEMPALEIYLYWHASVDADPAGAWLRAQLTRAFQA